MKLRTRAGLMAMAVALVPLTGACSSSDSSGAESTDAAPASVDGVEVVSFAFEPAEITVATGEPLTFTNTSSSNHTVSPDPASTQDTTFEGIELGAGESGEVTFDAAGTYEYVCEIHPDRMVGTVVVTG